MTCATCHDVHNKKNMDLPDQPELPGARSAVRIRPLSDLPHQVTE